MTSIFDELVGEPQTPKNSIFDSLGSKSPVARSNLPSSASIPGASSDPDYYKPGAPRPPKSPARQLALGVADAVDLLYTGAIGMPLSAAREQTTRTQREVERTLGFGAGAKMDRKGIAVEAASDAGRIQERYNAPVTRLLRNLGILEDAQVEQAPSEWAFDKISKVIDEKAQAVEQRTGGTILKEDVTALLNMSFGALGVKGVQATVKSRLDQAKAKQVAGELKAIEDDAARARLEAEERVKNLPPESRVEIRADTLAENARFETERKALNKKKRADARAAFLGDPDLTLEAKAERGLELNEADLMQARGEGIAEAREAAEARRLALIPDRQRALEVERKQAAGYRLSPEEEAVLAAGGTPRNRIQTPPAMGLAAPLPRPQPMPDGTPFGTADARGTADALHARGLADTLKRGEAGKLTTSTDPAVTGLEKVRTGRLFSMTAEERIAMRRLGVKGQADQRTLTALALGGTALALALQYDPDEREQALAMGAGVVMMGRGARRRVRADWDAMSPATPLAAVLDGQPYTLSTLEALPQNRFEFSKQQIADLVKRQEVTKLERDVFEQVLREIPGDKVTAKELVQGLDLATGTFQLTKAVTDDFADYGIDQIGREVGDSGAWIPEDATPAEMVRLQAEDAARQAQIPPTATHVWQSPVETGEGNHFGDPNYFGHTRVFEEDGVRHVVEIQSDYAQKAGKVLTPEERAKLEASFENLTEQANVLDQRFSGGDLLSILESLRRLNEDIDYKLANFYDEVAVLKAVPREVATQEHPTLGRMDYPDPEVIGEWLSKNFDSLPDEVQVTIRTGLFRALNRYAKDASVWRQETRSKLESAASPELAPMLKGWEKRLIREELADAARSGEAQVRFATADTVAKVEGWPRLDEARRARQGQLHGYLQNLPNGARADQWREELRILDSQSIRFRPEHQGIYDRYSKDVEKFLKKLGGKPVTDVKGETWIEVPIAKGAVGKRAQLGGVDPELAKAVAAIGGGAGVVAFLSSEENRASNAAIAAAVLGLAGLAKSRSPAVAEMAEAAGRGLERIAGNMSTEVRAISQTALRRMTKHELNVLKATHDRLQATAPFVDGLRTLPTAARNAVSAALLTGDRAQIVAALGKAGAPGLLTSFEKVRSELARIGSDLVETGRLKGLVEDYFPRIVVDAEGLLNKLGRELRDPLEAKLAALDAKAMRNTGSPLDPVTRSRVINQWLKSQAGTGKPGFLKKRSVGEVTEELAPFYASAGEGLVLYMRAATREIERAKFFGEDLVRNPEGLVDLEASIGQIVDREMLANKLPTQQRERLRQILRSRFGPGEAAAARPIQVARNLTYAGLLANPFSALVQVGDLAASAAVHGMLPTLRSLASQARGRKEGYRLSDLGLVDTISEEFVSAQRKPVTVLGRQVSSAKALDKAFRLSGFSAVDTLMKETNVNAAREKYRRLALSVAGQQKILRDYGNYFGDDTPQLIADLRSGEKSPLVTELLFRELSDVQPISKLEMPEAYVSNPNARVLWMLKSFMLKQVNLVRERGIRQIKAGRRAEGFAFLARYGMAMGLAGATLEQVNNWLLGRDGELEASDIPMNLLKTFGWSQYMLDQVRKGKPVETIAGMAGLPWEMWDRILTRDPAAIRYLPLAGRLLHDRYFGGAEKANESRERRERREESEGEE